MSFSTECLSAGICAVEGRLKGFDTLVNLVLDECVEYIRGRKPSPYFIFPSPPHNSTCFGALGDLSISLCSSAPLSLASLKRFARRSLPPSLPPSLPSRPSSSSMTRPPPPPSAHSGPPPCRGGGRGTGAEGEGGGGVGSGRREGRMPQQTAPYDFIHSEPINL